MHARGHAQFFWPPGAGGVPLDMLPDFAFPEGPGGGGDGGMHNRVGGGGGGGGEEGPLRRGPRTHAFVLNGGGDAATQGDTWYVACVRAGGGGDGGPPRCHCLVSRYPFWRLHFEVLLAIARAWAAAARETAEAAGAPIAGTPTPGSFLKRLGAKRASGGGATPARPPASKAKFPEDLQRSLRVLLRTHAPARGGLLTLAPPVHGGAGLAFVRRGDFTRVALVGAPPPPPHAPPSPSSPDAAMPSPLAHPDAGGGVGLADDETAAAITDWCAPLAFSGLPLDVVLGVLGAALTEHKIVFVRGAAPLDVVSSVVLTLAALVRPFAWVWPLLAVLPDAMCEMLEAPMPLAAGVCGLPPGFVRDGDTVVVHVDRGEIEQPEPGPGESLEHVTLSRQVRVRVCVCVCVVRPPMVTAPPPHAPASPQSRRGSVRRQPSCPRSHARPARTAAAAPQGCRPQHSRTAA